MTGRRWLPSLVIRAILRVAGVLALVAGVSAQEPEPPTGRIEGLIVDSDQGSPLDRVSVRLQSTGEIRITGADGRFVFDPVAPGPQELYVSAVDFLLVKRTIVVEPGSAASVTIALTEGTGTYAEAVTVRGAAPARDEPAVAAELTLRSAQLAQLRSVLANDPLRAVQTLPAVAAGDDFRSEFAVRGAGVDRTLFTFEGIATPFLLHTVRNVTEGGSVAMINGDVIDQISLRSGAYPERHGNRTGAELEFLMREGSRSHFESHASVSVVDASVVTEGPLAGGRGSWLVAGRKSYLDYVLRRVYPDQTVSFGFTDAQLKIVFDVNGRNQLQFATTAGVSRLERPVSELSTAGSLQAGDNRGIVSVLTWRYTRSPQASIVQRVATAGTRFSNTSREGPELDGGSGLDVLYRFDGTWAPRQALTFEAGGEVRHAAGSGREQRTSGTTFVSRQNFVGATTGSSAYAQAKLGGAGGALLVGGARVDHWSLTGHASVSPWAEGAWPLTSKLTVRTGTGLYRQEPELDQLLGSRGSAALEASRAWHADAGLEGRVNETTRWQITLYDREDRSLPRLPSDEPRASAAGVYLAPSVTSRWIAALDGYARGVEWLVERRSPNGLSGWISWAIGYAHLQDRTTGEAFWADYDQRHTINAYGEYRLSDRLSVSGRVRVGSNFPVTGYWAERDGTDYLSATRNVLRLPAYARADARANRTFTWRRRRLTLFAEVLNVFNRDNQRLASPSVNRRTLVTTGLLGDLLPLVPSVGALLEF